MQTGVTTQTLIYSISQRVCMLISVSKTYMQKQPVLPIFCVMAAVTKNPGQYGIGTEEEGWWEEKRTGVKGLDEKKGSAVPLSRCFSADENDQPGMV